MRWIIFAGRFQPFHLGHFEVAAETVAQLKKNDVMILAAIAPGLPGNAPIDAEFAVTAAEHHLPERNPWPLPIRLLALSSVAAHFRQTHPGRAMAISGIPRPDYGLNSIRIWFPGERIWIIPSAKEEFDEAKVQFFVSNGEQVVRRADNTSVSGKELRQLWASGKADEMKAYLPQCVRSAYLMWGVQG